jgi:tight adherence protein B
LAVVPLLLAVFFYVTTPGYMEELTEVSSGRIAIALALAAQVAGFLVIRKIVNIRI